MIDLKKLEKIVEKATPGPWGPYTANIPFYADVKKPAPSLSKHDHDRPTYWRIEDATFVAAARVALPELIEEVTRLQEALLDIMNHHAPYDSNHNLEGQCCDGCIARAALEGK